MTARKMHKATLLAAAGAATLTFALSAPAGAAGVVSASVTTVTTPSVSPSTTVPSTVPSEVLGETVQRGGLAVTGTDAVGLAVLGTALVGGGAALLGARRRRAHT